MRNWRRDNIWLLVIELVKFFGLDVEIGVHSVGVSWSCDPREEDLLQ